MGSQTRKLRKHTTGLSRESARRVAHNLSRHLEQLPASDAAQAKVKAELEQLTQAERVQRVASRLSMLEIRRRLQMPVEEQYAQYGFAIRGGIGGEEGNVDMPQEAVVECPG